MKQEIESLRDECSEAAALAYSQNLIDLHTFEEVTGDIVSARSRHALTAIQKSLREMGLQASQALGTGPASSSTIEVSMGTVKKQGQWLPGPKLEVQASWSTVDLDFTQYHDRELPDIHLHLNCKWSTLRLFVPESFEILEQLESQNLSSFHQRGSGKFGGTRVFVRGRISGSSLIVKYRSSKRGFWRRLWEAFGG